MDAMVRIDKAGRLVVPANLRKALKIKTGDKFIAQVKNGSIRLIPIYQAVSLAQKVVKQYAPAGTSQADELIQARREEARGE